MAPRWPQDGPNVDLEVDFDCVLRCIFALGLHFGPKHAQDGPEMAQDGPKIAQDGLKVAQAGPQEASKTAQ